MCGLAVCRLGDLDAPLLGAIFQRGPVEGTVQTALELPAQRLRVVSLMSSMVPPGGKALKVENTRAWRSRGEMVRRSTVGDVVVFMSESYGG